MSAFRTWLKERGLLQKHAAEALGVSCPEVNRYCRDGFWPTKAVALRLLYFTGGAVTPMSGLDPGEITPEAIRASAEFQAALDKIAEVSERRQEKIRGGK